MILWRYEIRRTGWPSLSGPPVAAALVVVLAVLNTRASGAATARTLLSALEMAVPLAAGTGTAALVGRDPVVELQLSLPTPYRVTLARRLIITLAWSAVVALVVAGALLATGWWSRWPANHGALAGQLTWLAPTCYLGAVGFLGGAVFHSPAAAGGLVATLWTFEQIFAEATQEHRWSRLLYPFATTRGAVAADWAENRITLMIIGLVCIALGWLVLGRTERLVDAGTA
jgi:hypothetical protein